MYSPSQSSSQRSSQSVSQLNSTRLQYSVLDTKFNWIELSGLFLSLSTEWKLLRLNSDCVYQTSGVLYKFTTGAQFTYRTVFKRPIPALHHQAILPVRVFHTFRAGEPLTMVITTERRMFVPTSVHVAKRSGDMWQNARNILVTKLMSSKSDSPNEYKRPCLSVVYYMIISRPPPLRPLTDSTAEAAPAQSDWLTRALALSPVQSRIELSVDSTVDWKPLTWAFTWSLI